MRATLIIKIIQELTPTHTHHSAHDYVVELINEETAKGNIVVAEELANAYAGLPVNYDRIYREKSMYNEYIPSQYHPKKVGESEY